MPFHKLWKGGCFHSNTDELQASNVRLGPHHFADCFEVKCANHFGMIPFFFYCSAAWFVRFAIANVFFLKASSFQFL